MPTGITIKGGSQNHVTVFDDQQFRNERSANMGKFPFAGLMQSEFQDLEENRK